MLSDIHGNWPALEAVLEQATTYDKVIFLGDAVGYYPDGNRVLDWLRSVNATCILGNHDAWMMSLDALEPGGPIYEILAWQNHQLTNPNREFLAVWPWDLQIDGALLVHGSPCDPMTYVDNLDTGRAAFECCDYRWSFHGHTHLAGAFLALNGPSGLWVRHQRYSHTSELVLAPKARALVNPGSVGQPRDGNPTAAYAIWDTVRQTVEFYRTEFNLDQVLARLQQEGFPLWLYERLKIGK